jgi:CTP:molybdopterin cytidylyltransferase MocA
MDKAAVVILAAGYSQRFTRPKALLLFDRTRTFLEKILNEYLKFGCSQIALTLNEWTMQAMDEKLIERIGEVAKIIVNQNPDYGRFYSLQLGCKEISDNDFCFMQNVDNPFVNRNLLDQLYNERSRAGYTAPVFEGKGGHPILLSNSVVNAIAIEKNLETNTKDFLQKFEKVESPAPDGFVLVNINTPQDYEKFLGKSCEAHIRGNIIHL